MTKQYPLARLVKVGTETFAGEFRFNLEVSKGIFVSVVDAVFFNASESRQFTAVLMVSDDKVHIAQTMIAMLSFEQRSAAFYDSILRMSRQSRLTS